ncbi:MAG: hypothetical protein KDK45_11725, partial [Leptospiraceae bacterium]|nr:hypothetical protein [Leptospiraceae bacterium]
MFEYKKIFLLPLLCLDLFISCASLPEVDFFPKPEGINFSLEKGNTITLSTQEETGEIHKSFIGFDESSSLFWACGECKNFIIYHTKNTLPYQKYYIPRSAEKKEGKIYAVALSPDKRKLAIGGWTGYSWQGSFSLYIFSIQNAELLFQFSDLPAPIKAVNYSFDGNFILVGLGGGYGIRVFSLKENKVYMADKNYTTGIKEIKKGHDGNYYVLSEDASYKVYSPDFRIKFARKEVSKNCRYSFSNKAEYLFSHCENDKQFSYEYIPKNNLLSWNTIHSGKFISPSASYTPVLFPVKLSSGGFYLIYKNLDFGYELFYYPTPNAYHKVIYKFPSKPLNIASSEKDNLLIYDEKAEFKLFYKNGIQFSKTQRTEKTFTGKEERILLSYDASRIVFDFGIERKHMAAFSLLDRKLLLKPPEVSDLYLNKVESEDLYIRNWKNSRDPIVYDREILQSANEVSKVLTIS